ncbi:MAG TPA: hypothetical protein VJR92_01440 [Gemmatimonadaceae bacterium]|nr:hypothetical protein [Gemmatimonadaceae bacterium]
MKSLLTAAALCVTAAAGPTAYRPDPTAFGPPWISIEYPVNPYDQTTRDAYLVVHAYHHGTPTEFPVRGTAEGIVDGKRRTVSLEFARTSRPGVFALKKQWSDAGTWALMIAVAQGKDDQAQAIVNVGTDGRVASVRVPTKRQDNWTVPAPVSVAEIEKELRARAAASN